MASVLIDERLELPVPFNTTHSENLSDWSGDTAAPAFRKLIADLTAMAGVPIEATTHHKAEAEKAKAPEETLAPQKATARSPLKMAAVLGGLAIVTTVSLAVFFIQREPGREPLEWSTTEIPTPSFASPEMVEVAAGCFDMGNPPGEGDDDERPRHRVCLERFALGTYEVTFDEYDRFAKATQRKKTGDGGWGRGRRPVINVSWQDAGGYARWLSSETGKSYRLPTEAEWEYAAQAGTKTRYWWGEEIGENRANCRGCRSQWDGKQTVPVGSFDENPWGLYDTVGNVGEWVEDCWHGDYKNAPDDGRAWLKEDGGDCRQRVIRGGSWGLRPRFARAATRYWHLADFANDIVGFRLAQDL